MRDRAAGGLADQTCIFGERACPMPRRTRLPGLPPQCEFLLVDQNVHPACAGIDPDAIAVAQQRQRSADKGFRRDIADTHAARRTGKPSVGDQRDLLAHSLPVDQRGDAEHLAHAGTADRTFIADHQHFACRIVAVADGIDASFLILEYARVAFEYEVLQAGDLDHGAIGTEIALEHGHATVRHDRLAHRIDDLSVGGD